MPPPPRSTLFPYTTLFRSVHTGYRWYLAAWDTARNDWRTFRVDRVQPQPRLAVGERFVPRSEEHTSELQSQSNLVCRLLLEKKKNSVSRPPSSRVARAPPR